MIVSRAPIVPRYVETDQMGFVAPARYIVWLEIGRAALLKDFQMDYRQFEADGYLIPVLEVGLTLILPAHYDDSLIVVTTLAGRPSFRMRLDYEIWRGESLLATGFTVQGFVNRQHRPVKPPPSLMAKIDQIFPRPARLGTGNQNSAAGP